MPPPNLPTCQRRCHHRDVIGADDYDVVMIMRHGRRQRPTRDSHPFDEALAYATRRHVSFDDGHFQDVAVGVGDSHAVGCAHLFLQVIGHQLIGDDADHAGNGAFGRDAQIYTFPGYVHRVAQAAVSGWGWRKYHGSIFGDQDAAAEDQARTRRLQIVEDHEVGATAGCDRSTVVQSKVAGRIPCRHAQGRDRSNPSAMAVRTMKSI